MKIRKCKCCGDKFSAKDSRTQFCSRSCSAKFNNPRRVITLRKKRVIPPTKWCELCNTPLKWYQKRFCSMKCDERTKFDATASKIEAGIKVNVATLRKYLLIIKEHRCEICNNTEWCRKPIPLCMDHIDGNATNDNLNNLRLICPNCDRFLPTFGSRNKGFGRKSRGIK